MPHFTVTFPPVSLVIPAYNEARWLPQTLDAVLSSGFPAEVLRG